MAILCTWHTMVHNVYFSYTHIRIGEAKGKVHKNDAKQIKGEAIPLHA